MKRIGTLGLLMLSLLWPQVSRPSIGQEAAQQKSTPFGWKELGSGVSVLRVWEIPQSPKQPEIAILKLSEEEYRKFTQNRKAYTNDHHIFPQPVDRIVICKEEEYEKKTRAGKDDPQVAVLIHMPTSTSVSVDSTGS
jgi:hypothetical protein